jgi:leucyl aminopeptidase (aminopeptidase T)
VRVGIRRVLLALPTSVSYNPTTAHLRWVPGGFGLSERQQLARFHGKGFQDFLKKMAPPDIGNPGGERDHSPPMKDFEVLATMAGMRALADPTRLQMVRLLTRNPATGSMLARDLSIPANRAHYHLQRLLEAGLIQEVGEGPRRLTGERFYAATARHFLIDPGVGGVEDRPTIALRQSIDNTFLDWRRSQLLAIDWGDLARLAVHQTLRVRQNDHVMILFAPIALELAEAILVEIEACGAVVYPRPWSRNIILRTLDRYPPEVLENLPFIPGPIDERLTAAMLITSNLVQGSPPNPTQQERLPRFLQSVSRWKQSVRNRGLRYLHVGLPHRAEFSRGYLTPEAGIDAFWRCMSADLEQIRKRGEHLLQIVPTEPDLVIHGQNQAELRVTLDADHAAISDGIISKDDLLAGRSTESLPAGSFTALPAAGTGDGVFEADYTFSSGRHIPRVRVVLRQGRIVELDAASDADVIRERLAREAGDPDLLSSVTIGLNPGGPGPTGRPELDSVLAGVVTLDFGNNELLGGNVKSTFNLSLPAHGLTVRTRTKSVVVRGRLAGPNEPKRGSG